MMRQTRPEALPFQEYGEVLDTSDVNEDARYLEIDWERTELVLGDLITTYRQNGFPYYLEAARVPQDERFLPEDVKDDPRLHAMFFFTSCYYMRGGIRSNDAIRRLGQLWELERDIFIPEKARNLSRSLIVSRLTEVGLGFQQTVADQILENSKRLCDRFEGDPLKIFEHITNYQEALELIQNDGNGKGFKGFQEKMVSMIAYYFVEQGLVEYFHFPLPVDIHVFRVTAATEMIKFHGFKESSQPTVDNFGDEEVSFDGDTLTGILRKSLSPFKLTEDEKTFLRDNLDEINELWDGDNIYSQYALDLMRHLYSEYALQHKIDMIELCNVVWLLSQTICGKQPGNQTTEPLSRAERSGRSTLLIPVVEDLGSFAQRKAFADSCGQCPLHVNGTCTHSVPAKTYYVHGDVAFKPRSTYPPLPEQFQLF